MEWLNELKGNIEPNGCSIRSYGGKSCTDLCIYMPPCDDKTCLILIN